MATVDSGKDSSLIIMWDLEEGNRIASMKPYQGNVSGIAFSSDNKYLVTVGFDTNARCTVLLWDITLLTLNNGIVIGSKSQCVIARQVSDVDIAKVRFLPVDGMNLVSCGRENVRLWRVRKTHFPSRPIILKEYCRGYNYTDIAISADKSNAEEVHFYVSSNKGVLLRIDYKSEQVLCAFQLHTMAINCVRIFNGYCVTGGSDNKLRIWPLDFGDFLLEARHEGRICNIHITSDGKKQVIGTDSGTLGVLDVTEHR